MTKKLKYLLIFTAATLLSCEDTIIKQKNDPDDLKMILEQSRIFYMYRKKGYNDSIRQMLNRYEIKPDEGMQFINKLGEGYGNLVKVEPLTVYSNFEYRNNKISQADANVISKVYYEKAKFKETVTFKYISDSFKVNSYFFELLPDKEAEK